MNNKGFAITGFIYTIFILFIIVMIAILNMFNARKNILDRLKSEVIQDVNSKIETASIQKFESSDQIQQFSAYKSGFYKFTLKSPKGPSNYGGIISFEIYLNKDEIIYMKVGKSDSSFNDVIVSFDKTFDSKNNIASASYVPDRSVKNMVNKIINDRVTYNPTYQENANNSNNGSVEVIAISKSKINDDLNRVQYIKSCSQSSLIRNENIWSEIRAIVSGENKALGKTVTIDSPGAKPAYPLSNAVDGDITTSVRSIINGKACIVVDLGRPYNLDSIHVLHENGVAQYDNKIYVSSDNKEYKIIYNNDIVENESGVIIDAYDDKKVMNIGNVSMPVEKKLGITWLRLFYHNNLSGKVYWDAVAQPLTEGGYDEVHKQSALYNISAFKNKNGKYEFLLAYNNDIIQWSQTSNPIDKTESVTGFVHIFNGVNSFTGLALSNSGTATLDGSRSNAYYPVGVIKDANGIVVDNSKTLKNVITELWVRIDN